MSHPDAVKLLVTARIPKSDVRHDNTKHTLVKKYFELAPDPPSATQLLQVRYLERQRSFTPCIEVFESFDAMQQFLHAMWPGGREGANMWKNFLDAARNVIRNPDSLIVPAAVTLNETQCTET